ncbi:MAG TPA: methylmalonyl Co-A mutase-associated GTPase MeaB [Trebonia sp.]|nr:methylmalonyl Co-A mutase-associated GTPase MeaB [Trebonia sp.]
MRRLADGVLARDARSLARAISWIENGDGRGRLILRELAAAAAGRPASGPRAGSADHGAEVGPPPGVARVIGLTGAPGAGKSTTTSALVTALRARGEQVAVLAVDPSSPFSGGALLGDRVRMQGHATDPGVFIRSMASRGQLGGLSAAAPMAIRALEAAGFSVILVETVGVGQAVVEIASAADSTVVVVVPGMGDSIQVAKAGVLEIADVLVVNKADRPDTAATVRDINQMVALSSAPWKPPVVPTVATTSEGIGELLGALDRHWDWLASAGELARRRRARARDEVLAIAYGKVRGRLAGPLLDTLAGQVADGVLDPHEASGKLLSSAGYPVTG